MLSSGPPLKISNLLKDYGSIRAVNDVSFEIQPGEVYGLLGPNGAGKTTIISSIMTLEEPTEGSISVFGKTPHDGKALIGFVPQELIHHGYFNVLEVVRFHSSYYGLKDSELRITYLLKRLELWEHRYKLVNHLSGGMKRRLLIIKALLHSPKLVLLDEPTAGVDIDLRENLWEFIKELRSEGTAVLLTTHYLEEAQALCDRIGVLNKGQIIKEDTTENLLKLLTKREVYVYLTKQLPPIKHPLLQEQTEETLRFSMPYGAALSDLQLDYSSVKDIHIREGSLEDVFQTLVRNHE